MARADADLAHTQLELLDAERRVLEPLSTHAPALDQWNATAAALENAATAARAVVQMIADTKQDEVDAATHAIDDAEAVLVAAAAEEREQVLALDNAVRAAVAAAQGRRDAAVAAERAKEKLRAVNAQYDRDAAEASAFVSRAEAARVAAANRAAVLGTAQTVVGKAAMALGTACVR